MTTEERADRQWWHMRCLACGRNVLRQYMHSAAFPCQCGSRDPLLPMEAQARHPAEMIFGAGSGRTEAPPDKRRGRPPGPYGRYKRTAPPPVDDGNPRQRWRMACDTCGRYTVRLRDGYLDGCTRCAAGWTGAPRPLRLVATFGDPLPTRPAAAIPDDGADHDAQCWRMECAACGFRITRRLENRAKGCSRCGRALRLLMVATPPGPSPRIVQRPPDPIEIDAWRMACWYAGDAEAPPTFHLGAVDRWYETETALYRDVAASRWPFARMRAQVRRWNEGKPGRSPRMFHPRRETIQ